jgi:hypothetical protein
MDVIWWVTAVVGAIAVNLIASELFAWGPRLSEWLMRCAVRRLAPEMQDRMREEWAGHLQTIPPGLWRIVAAAGFYLAARRINVALRGRRHPLDEVELAVFEIGIALARFEELNKIDRSGSVDRLAPEREAELNAKLDEMIGLMERMSAATERQEKAAWEYRTRCERDIERMRVELGLPDLEDLQAVAVALLARRKAGNPFFMEFDWRVDQCKRLEALANANAARQRALWKEPELTADGGA